MNTVETIREALPITGRLIVEITTDDWDDVVSKYPNPADRISRVYLHLDNGSTASFVIGEGRLAFSYDGFDPEHPFSVDQADGAGPID